MNNWKETTLGEVIELQRGFDLPVQHRTAGKYPLLVSNGIDGFVEEYKVQGPGVVTGRSGTLGKVFYVKDNFWPLNTTLWVKNFKGNDEKFIYYWLLNFPFEKFNAGSGVPTLNRNHVHPAPVSIPKSVKEQKAIAGVLSSFDDKIDLLRRQNKTLEAIAQTIFKEWSINFTVQGKKLKLNPKTHLPEGWRMGKLSDISKNIKNGININNLQNHEHYVGLEHIGRKQMALYNWGRADEVESNKFLFTKGDILFGKLRAYFHKVCFAPIKGICSTDILVIRPANPRYYELCLMWFFSEDVVKYSDASSSGTRMPRTNWNILSEYKIPIPNDEILVKFNQVIKPLIDKVERNIFSIQTLSKLRDTLLPKLMKGDIRVKSKPV
jgi:type I restriction enzyme S subunit